MEKKVYPEIKYDLLHKTVREIVVKGGLIEGEKFEKMTQGLGLVLSCEHAFKTAQELVGFARNDLDKKAKCLELQFVQNLYEDALKNAYDAVCEAGGEEFYTNLLKEENKEQE